MKMPRRKNKSASARAPAQSTPSPEPEVLLQLEFDSFISMDLPVRPTIIKCRSNYLDAIAAVNAKLQKIQSGTTDGTYSPDPPADTTTACTKPTASTKGDIDSPIENPENRKTNTPDNEPTPPMHTAMLLQYPPQTIPFSNSPQPSSTPASSSYEDSCATHLRQQDPASSSQRIIQASPPLLALQP